MNWIDDIHQHHFKDVSVMHCLMEIIMFINRHDLFISDRKKWNDVTTIHLCDILRNLGYRIERETFSQRSIVDILIENDSIEALYMKSNSCAADISIAAKVLLALYRMHRSGIEPSVNKAVYLVSNAMKLSDRKVFSCWSRYKGISHLSQARFIRFMIWLTEENETEFRNVGKELANEFITMCITHYLVESVFFMHFGLSKKICKNSPFVNETQAWHLRFHTLTSAMFPKDYHKMEHILSQTDEECLNEMLNTLPDDRLLESPQDAEWTWELRESEIAILQEYRAPKRI